jgi:hypothetical protein
VILSNCPRCGATSFRLIRSRQTVRREQKLRSRFVFSHLDYRPKPAELMDLTRFMHHRPEALAECAVCGLVVRDEHEPATYGDDEYDPQLLAHLFPRYLDAFRAKSPNYRGTLRPHAEVLEIGSHTGAFLAAAEEWGWRPTGLDIGETTSRFARSMGLRVRRLTAGESRVPPHSLDAAFIWNCFEQLEDPGGMLLTLRPLLRTHGSLVVRVPNFAWYQRGDLPSLAWNNLLGFPYLVGYTPRTLTSLVSRYGFAPVTGVDSVLLTMPFPERTPEMERESRNVNGRFLSEPVIPPMSASGPWIEMTFRASE